MIVNDYFVELQDLIDRMPREPLEEAILLLKQARLDGRAIFVFGNGGSAATALHMVCDLVKNTRRDGLPPMRVIGLNDNMPTFSAYANDEGYQTVFAEPLKALAYPGDVVIAISGSGNSPNVLRGVEAAREMGLTTIALTGFQGGELRALADVCAVVPSDNMQYIEDLHLIINHILTRALYRMEKAP
jgi:D-sedoheptulose 7-phosphate isomerase